MKRRKASGSNLTRTDANAQHTDARACTKNSRAIRKLLHDRGLSKGVIFDEYKRCLKSRLKNGAYEVEYLSLVAPEEAKGISLDVGCGLSRTGTVDDSDERTCVGIDSDPKMLRLARHVENSNAQLVCADAARLPFSSGTFESVCAIDILEHVGDMQVMVSEMRRVLESEGFLFLAVGNKKWFFEPHTMLPFMSYLPTRLVDIVCRKIRPGFLEWFGSYRYINLPTYQELKNRLIEARLSFSIWPRIEGYIVYPRTSLPPVGALDMRYYRETRKGRDLLGKYLLRHRHPTMIFIVARFFEVLSKTILSKWICTAWIVVAKRSPRVNS